MDLYSRIEALLRSQSMNKKQLSEATGIPYNYLLSVFRSKPSSMPEQYIELIAKFLNISVGFLENGEATEIDLMNYKKVIAFIQREATMNIGNQPFYISFVGVEIVDGITREVGEPTEKPMKSQEKLRIDADRFAYRFGLQRKKDEAIS